MHASFSSRRRYLALALVLLLAAALLMQAIATDMAQADSSWTDTNGALSSYFVDSLAYDSNHNMLYAGVHGNAGTYHEGVWKYNGNSWADTGGEISSFRVSSLAYDSNHNMLYAGCSDSTGNGKGVWKYSGTNWTNTGGSVASYQISCLVYDSVHSVLWAGTQYRGIWKYDGMSWTNVLEGIPVAESLAYDSTHNILYAGAPSVGVLKYDGTSWTNLSKESTLEITLTESLTYDSTHNLLYAGSYDHGVWKYDGTSWIDTGGGLSRYSVFCFTYDFTHNVLYAGANYGGVWRYDGTSWTNTGGSVVGYYIERLAYDSVHGVLYAGGANDSGGPAGVWKYDVSSPTPTPPTPTSRTWGHDSIGVTTPAQDWYLAEGCTNGGFETWVLVQNPQDSAADVQLTYMTPSGPVAGPSATLPPNSRKSFNVGETVSGQWEVSTKVHANKAVIAERAVYGPGRAWGTDSIGASKTSKTWYLAEGCTNGGFESWILVQNPNDKPADVTLTYMTPEGQKPGPSVSLPANSRKTFDVAEAVPGIWDVSTQVSSTEPVVAERAVYWNGRKGAHDSIGVTEPEKTWYLAEGCTNGGFETWVLVQNPGDSTASVDLTYMTESGKRAGRLLDLAPRSRKSVNVADAAPGEWGVSTKVTSNQPVIAERAVYWNGRLEGHDSIGTTEPAKTWYMAEGCTGAGFETWVLVQNPNSSPASVNITYMTPSGPVAGPSETLAANSRKTFNVAETVPGVYEVSTKVTSNVPVIAERAMYGDTK